jgi:hypothetical protein
MQLESQTIGSKSTLQPQVEMQFVTTEHAQRAVALLDSSKFDNPKVSISETVLEDRGRRLILKFDSFDAHPSDLVSFVFDVVDAVSAARPLTREVSIPLVKK